MKKLWYSFIVISLVVIGFVGSTFFSYETIHSAKIEDPSESPGFPIQPPV